MTFNERNDLINEAYIAYKVIHDRYTASTRILSDAEWTEYISQMDAVAEMYKLTSITDLSWGLCQKLLDDTEEVQKRLKKLEGKP